MSTQSPGNSEKRSPSVAGDHSPDPLVICDALAACCSDKDHLSIHSYLTAYRELSRFFHSLGTVFSFVAKDVDSKISILDSYCNDSAIGSHYATFQSMIEYEETNNLLKNTKRPSGCRTALRLHRALQFFSLFMLELAKVDGNEATGAIARDCYKKTLASYHSWMVQKTAQIAMYTLPTRDQLLSRTFGPSNSICSSEASSATSSPSKVPPVVGEGASTCPAKDGETNGHSEDKKSASLSSSASSQGGNSGDIEDEDAEKEEWKQQSDQMLKLAQLSNSVYDAVQCLYQEKKLLDLP